MPWHPTSAQWSHRQFDPVIKQAVRLATIPAENVGLTSPARMAQTRDALRTAYHRQFTLIIKAGRYVEVQ